MAEIIGYILHPPLYKYNNIEIYGRYLELARKKRENTKH